MVWVKFGLKCPDAPMTKKDDFSKKDWTENFGGFFKTI